MMDIIDVVEDKVVEVFVETAWHAVTPGTFRFAPVVISEGDSGAAETRLNGALGFEFFNPFGQRVVGFQSSIKALKFSS